MRLRALSLSLPLLCVATALGCAKEPPLDRVRFEVGVSDAVAKLVSYESTPETDTSSKFHGIAEKGITTSEGVGIVLNIEPQTTGKTEALDGTLSASSADTAVATVREVDEKEEPGRRIVLLAQAPGTTKLRITVDSHDGAVEIPITVKAQ